MFRNYLLVALRNLYRQPVFSAIKVLSLTLGLVCSILVLMHVQFSNSFDKHFDDWQNIYRLGTSFTTDQRLHTNSIAEGYFNPLLADYAQIETAAKIQDTSGIFAYGDISVPNDYSIVDPEFLTIFSFDFIQGDRLTALLEPNTVVLSETAARKYFGNEDPFGKTLTLENRVDLRVTGLYRDLPPNTHFDIDILMSVETARLLVGENFMNGTSWAGFGGTRAYLLIPNADAAQALAQDLPAFIDRNVPDNQRDFVERIDITLELEPLSALYLSPRQGFGTADNTRSLILAGLVSFATLILLSSCINFANLSLSQMQQRGKEIGIRKTLGARRNDLLQQFIIESLLLTLVAFAVALPIVYLLTPVYTSLTSTGFEFSAMLQSTRIIWILLFTLLVGLLSGLIPALRMSRFEPSEAISGKRDGGKSSRLARSSLTVIQFSFAVVLVILAIAISLQVRLLNQMNVGFNQSNLIVLDSMYNPRNPDNFNYDAMVNELKQHAGIVAVGKSEAAPPNNGGYNPWRHSSWPADQVRAISHLGVDENYLDAMQLQLLAGRNFSQDFPADFMPSPPDLEQTYSILITEAAVSNFELGSNEAAIDQVLVIGQLNFRVVGVINDFRLSGGLEDVLRSTSILRASSQPMRTLLIRIDPRQRASALAHIDEVWARHRPDAPVDREFYEQIYDTLVYEQTNGINRAAQFAALITIMIAALGLYALAFYSTERRTKEIGVRKVLGASTQSIIGLLALDFIKPVLLACLIASVCAWFATGFYLNQFATQAAVPWVVYAMTLLGTVLLALLTVAAQCYRTARADPIRSLRSE